jgi:hypothetical protein
LPLVSPEDESLRAGLEFLRENNPILKSKGLDSRPNRCVPRTVLCSRLPCGVNPARWARNRKARCKPPGLGGYIACATQRTMLDTVHGAGSCQMNIIVLMPSLHTFARLGMASSKTATSSRWRW